MRENLIQTGARGKDGRIHVEYDWYSLGIPENVFVEENVYLDTSYGFACFHSQKKVGMKLGKGSGCYDRATFISGPEGEIIIGAYTILNGTTIISHKAVKIGNHCMLAWGSVISDSWLDEQNTSIEQRSAMLQMISQQEIRMIPSLCEPREVILEDNVWVGFDAVILPGVTLGRSCLVGSKTVISEDVPPYAVVAGNPARVIRYLDHSDTVEARADAFKNYLAGNKT